MELPCGTPASEEAYTRAVKLITDPCREELERRKAINWTRSTRTVTPLIVPRKFAWMVEQFYPPLHLPAFNPVVSGNEKSLRLIVFFNKCQRAQKPRPYWRLFLRLFLEEHVNEMDDSMHSYLQM